MSQLSKLALAILAILASNAWNLVRWTGLPHQLNMRFSLWFASRTPTNWSGLVGKLKAAVKPIMDVARKL